MLDKAFYEEEVRRLCLAFEQQVFFVSIEIPKVESNTIEPGCIMRREFFAVPLRGVLCVYEVERAGNQEPDVDIRMCCTEPEVEDPRQCRLHVLSQVRSE